MLEAHIRVFSCLAEATGPFVLGYVIIVIKVIFDVRMYERRGIKSVTALCREFLPTVGF